MPWRNKGASAFGLVSCGRSSLWQHGDATRTLRPGAQAQVERVVGRGVAGVQGDHHVDRLGHDAAQVALHEAQPFALRARGGFVAQRDQLGAQLDAGHLGSTAEAPAQVRMHREREVALARAVVDDARRDGVVAAHAGVVERVLQHLEELVDLLPLARHRRHQAMALVGDAEIDPERQVQRQRPNLGTVVRLPRRLGRGAHGTRRAHQRLPALLAETQLQLGIAGVQRRVRERRLAVLVEQGNDSGTAGGGIEVACQVAGRVAVDERERGLAAQLDRPDAHALQVARASPVLREHQRHQAPVADRLVEGGDEFVVRRHRAILGDGPRRDSGAPVGDTPGPCSSVSPTMRRSSSP
jgi:hypothetical protein